MFGILAISFFMNACTSSSDTSEFKFGIGKFKFVMYDSAGGKMCEGTLDVKTYSQDKISGTYNITKKYNTSFDGYNVMDGEFGGDISLQEKRVFINTNPRIADANVFWNLDMKKNYLSGEWNFSLFRGTGSKGKIKITN